MCAAGCHFHLFGSPTTDRRRSAFRRKQDLAASGALMSAVVSGISGQSGVRQCFTESRGTRLWERLPAFEEHTAPLQSCHNSSKQEDIDMVRHKQHGKPAAGRPPKDPSESLRNQVIEDGHSREKQERELEQLQSIFESACKACDDRPWGRWRGVFESTACPAQCFPITNDCVEECIRPRITTEDT